MRYVIQCVTDPDLLWSNDEGWTDSDNFESFTTDETMELNLPIDGKWVLLITS
jgi:hypothetical protein